MDQHLELLSQELCDQICTVCKLRMRQGPNGPQCWKCLEQTGIAIIPENPVEDSFSVDIKYRHRLSSISHISGQRVICGHCGQPREMRVVESDELCNMQYDFGACFFNRD